MNEEGIMYGVRKGEVGLCKKEVCSKELSTIHYQKSGYIEYNDLRFSDFQHLLGVVHQRFGKISMS